MKNDYILGFYKSTNISPSNYIVEVRENLSYDKDSICNNSEYLFMYLKQENNRDKEWKNLRVELLLMFVEDKRLTKISEEAAFLEML